MTNTDWPFAARKDDAKEYEAYETPEWAVKAILDVELLTPHVFDPCCGRGVMTKAARNRGYEAIGIDICDWGYGQIQDFLAPDLTERFVVENTTVFMNPPFSKAVEFVERSFELGARKIVCFQRMSWFESKIRREFWSKFPPNRIYMCGARASCWRIDITPEKRKIYVDENGKRRGGNTPTAHAWFVWERGQPPGTLFGHIYKG